jgi:serine/threonine-protein kinase HipA
MKNSFPQINFCPGTLAANHSNYSNLCLKQMFEGKKISHILSYEDLSKASLKSDLFLETQKRVSVSGVQEKFSFIVVDNELRLTKNGEQGTYILKTAPEKIKNALEMPANEHLTMQIAAQVYKIETAANCLIFFGNSVPALLVKRFDITKEAKKFGLEDFASLAQKTPQTHGADYKYQGNYFELFEILKKNVTSFKIESLKLYKLIIFNFLFSNGDAHLKNFSIIETVMGDYKMSPAYDLLNSRIHVDDHDFALEDGLLPKNLKKGKVKTQFLKLAELSDISEKNAIEILNFMCSLSEKVENIIQRSFLSDKLKRNYFQSYQTRLKKILR